MASMLRFDSQVALVIGAGSEPGRQCAIALAQRGATVVVNDIRKAYVGRPEATYVADLLVEEIKAAGGIATPNHDSVRYGDRIVRSVLETYGRIDIIVNCGMTTRDRPFHKVQETDWSLMTRISLRGVFLVLQAAWPHLKRQRAGRIVNVDTMEGVLGGENRSMTMAAKTGLLGLTKTLAAEGEKYRIRVNAVACLQTAQEFPASQVAPLLLCLAHESCEESGQVFEAGGGLVAKLRPQRSKGVCFPDFSLESVQRHWNEVTSFLGETDSPASAGEALVKFKRPKL